MASCSNGAPSAPAPTAPPPVAPTPAPAATQIVEIPAPAAPAVNRAMGIGEARNPEPFTLDQRLLDATSRNDRPTIDKALELGAKIQAKDDLGRSTLFRAVMDAGSLDLVRWLHEKGVPVDDADVSGRTPLSFAADYGYLEIVRYLVAQGAAIDRRDVQQRTPLMHAAGGDHPDIIELLAERGADINPRDQFGDTPLIAACAKGNASSAALLLQRGADTTIQDQEGRTAKERSAPDTAPCRSLPK